MNVNELEEEIEHCANLLKQGKVILYPTDTIWGIGCDATNSKAIDKIFKIKNRPAGRGLILLVDSFERLKNYVKFVPPVAADFIRSAKKPLSIIYSESKGLPKNISADSTVCIRVTDNEFCKKLIERLGKPITSTSANVSGEPSPSFFNEINEQMKNSVDYVVSLYHDVMTTPKPSTIIRLYNDNNFDVVRQ